MPHSNNVHYCHGRFYELAVDLFMDKDKKWSELTSVEITGAMQTAMMHFNASMMKIADNDPTCEDDLHNELIERLGHPQRRTTQ